MKINLFSKLFYALLGLMGALVFVTPTVGFSDNRPVVVYFGSDDEVSQKETSFTLLRGRDSGHHVKVSSDTVIDGEVYTQDCSGTFVSPRVIVTAGHCVLNDEGQLESPDVEYRNRSMWSYSRKAKVGIAYYNKSADLSKYEFKDWAILIAYRPFPRRINFPLVLETLPDDLPDAADVIGYPTMTDQTLTHFNFPLLSASDKTTLNISEFVFSDLVGLSGGSVLAKYEGEDLYLGPISGDKRILLNRKGYADRNPVFLRILSRVVTMDNKGSSTENIEHFLNLSAKQINTNLTESE